MLGNFFKLPGNAQALQPVQHDALLTSLSVGIAVLTSVLALHMLQVSMVTRGYTQRQITLCGASGVLGLGVWTMHFVGMLATDMAQHVHFEPVLTLLSLFPSLIASWLALRSITDEHVSTSQLVMGGLVMGIGIVLMHYSGMAAMHMPVQLYYIPHLFALSLAVALVLAVASFWLWHRLARQLHYPVALRLLAPATVLAAAITGMHYLSMLAVRVAPAASEAAPQLPANSHSTAVQVLMLCAAGIATLVLGSTLMRYRSLWLHVQRNEARLHAMTDAAADAVITIDARGMVHSFNAGAERIFGWSAQEIVGRSLNRLMPSPLNEAHNGYLARALQAPPHQRVPSQREVLGVHKDGRHIALRLSIGRVDTDRGPLFVGFAYDLTERKRTEGQLRLAASAFAHTCEGMAVIDANHLVVQANAAFWHHMQSDDSAAASFDALLEGLQGPTDVAAIWQAVHANGHWQGDITGATPATPGDEATARAPLRLSLNAVLNGQQKLVHYVAVLSEVPQPYRPRSDNHLPPSDHSAH